VGEASRNQRCGCSQVRVLDLFSGIGGFSLGLERAGMTTAAFCEIEEFPRAVLAKHWPDVPIYDDVRTLTADRLARDGVGRIDLVCGGYPCQPFSHAGKRAGAADDRHLWPEMRRVIGEVRPAWVVAENVAGHVTLGLDQVLADLEADGYAGRAVVVPACAVDAPHIRRRLWIVARDTDRDRDRESELPVDAEVAGVPRDMGDAAGDGRRQGRPVQAQQLRVVGGTGDGAEPLADADSERGRLRNLERQDAADARQPSRRSGGGYWDVEPGMGRVAHGVPARVDRLRGLGNAVVPQIVEEIGRAILAVDGAN
jgi:DNA (cytosine-5)-methyltransferase 1